MLVEFLLLLGGSILAGFLIASIVHYFSFGIHGDGFNTDAFKFAISEGGFVGALMGIPTGVIIYYGILGRRVTARRVAIILLGSLGGGLVLAMANPVASAILVPI